MEAGGLRVSASFGGWAEVVAAMGERFGGGRATRCGLVP